MSFWSGLTTKGKFVTVAAAMTVALGYWGVVAAVEAVRTPDDHPAPTYSNLIEAERGWLIPAEGMGSYGVTLDTEGGADRYYTKVCQQELIDTLLVLPADGSMVFEVDGRQLAEVQQNLSADSQHFTGWVGTDSTC